MKSLDYLNDFKAPWNIILLNHSKSFLFYDLLSVDVNGLHTKRNSSYVLYEIELLGNSAGNANIFSIAFTWYRAPGSLQSKTIAGSICQSMVGHLFQNYDTIYERFFFCYVLLAIFPLCGSFSHACDYFLLMRPFHAKNVMQTEQTNDIC